MSHVLRHKVGGSFKAYHTAKPTSHIRRDKTQKRCKVGVELLALRYSAGLDLWNGEPLKTVDSEKQIESVA